MTVLMMASQNYLVFRLQNLLTAWFWQWGLILLAFSLIAGCASSSHEEMNHEHAQSEETYTCPMHPQIMQHGPGSCPVCGMDLVPVATSDHASHEIMLNEAQILLANIKTQPAGKMPLEEYTLLTGRLVADEEQSETIASRVAGRIDKLYVKESGQPVRKGQPLYDIYSEPLLTYQQEFLLALEQVQQVDSSRYASLLSSARKKLLLYGMSTAQVTQLAKSKHMQPNIIFLAPVSGLVTSISVTEGAYVAEGEPLYRIENLQRLWVETALYPGEADKAKLGDAVQVAVNGYENTPVSGSIAFLNPEYETGSLVTLLRVAIDNPGRQFFPGMQAEVRLPKQSNPDRIVLPARAVIRDEQGNHVWLQTAEGTFASKMVSLGTETAEAVEITEGLQEGDTVVVSGAYLLYSEYLLKKGGEPMSSHQH